jgi:hypothetical protein
VIIGAGSHPIHPWTAYLAPVHMTCRTLLPRPFTPQAALLIFVLLNAVQP